MLKTLIISLQIFNEITNEKIIVERNLYNDQINIIGVLKGLETC